MGSLIIGIAGGSGSGKTTLIRRLQQQFKDHISVLYHDSYYYRHDELTLDERHTLNYDHPRAFDTPLLTRHLKELKKGNSIECPVYDYVQYNRTDEVVVVHPTDVIVVEGILIFAERKLREQMDIKIYVDTDADVRVLRRIKRDVEERGRELDTVINQYLTTVKPMHERFVEPSRHFADLIILEGGENQVATDMLIGRIRNHIAKNQSEQGGSSLSAK
ncbi:MAG: uridine kinase [Clostridiales bacterium]|nr:uridine kinase [Clostridiales bacterium]